MPPKAAPVKRQDLAVEALWHKEVHNSKVSALCFAADGLWSGCDAAVPTLQARDDEPPVAAVNIEDGSIMHCAASMPITNVRLLRPLADDVGRLLCVTGDGLMLVLGSTGEELGSCALPGAPAESSAAAPATAPCTPVLGDDTAAADDQQQAVPGNVAPPTIAAGDPHSEDKQEEKAGIVVDVRRDEVGPEFIEEAGYRGPRTGYLFRQGTKGTGYYRKDVAQRYCAASARGEVKRTGPGKTSAGSTDVSSGGTGATGSLDAAAVQGCDDKTEHQPATKEARQYIQRLMHAPPNMHSIITDASGTLLFTSSLRSGDPAIRVWRLHWDGRNGGSSNKDGSSGTVCGTDSQARGTTNCSGSAGGTGACVAHTSDAGCSTCPRPELLRTLTGHSEAVLALALSPSGDLLFSGSYDQTIRVWSTKDWHCMRVLKGHGGGVRALAVAPDGGMLYSAAGDNTIRAWSLHHWVCLRTLQGRHEDTTWSAVLALSPDGRLLASGSTGPFGASTIKIFQTDGGSGREPGTCLATFAQLRFDQKAGMSALLFSSNGSTLYSGASDGTLAAWHIRWRDVQSSGGIRKGFL